jgi:hypothetical protein
MPSLFSIGLGKVDAGSIDQADETISDVKRKSVVRIGIMG